MTAPYAVWAPDARTVELVVDDERVAMEPDAARSGWWASAREARPGERYAFSVDGGDPRPDPRSLSQPDGPHEPSEMVDLGAHTWGDSHWYGIPMSAAVVYELHVGTFTGEGTLDSAIERLGHLKELGVTMVELMPVAAFPGRRGWGYDGVDLYAVHEALGGPAAMQRFVDACHGHGLAVCLDVVYNHLGPSGNYLSFFGPYFTDRHHTPWGSAVNLDGAGSDEVRRFIVDNALMWMRDFHVDALRLDAVHALLDDRAEHLLEQLAREVDDLSGELGRHLLLIAESDRNDPATVTPRQVGGAGGLGLSAQWVDDVHHTLHVLLTGETQGYYADFAAPEALPKMLRTPFFHDGTWSSFRGREHGRPVAGSTPGWRFVASLQTHDQVGNRAVGERLSQIAGLDRAACGAALLLVGLPYVPMLFMGEEWAAGTPWQYFTDHLEHDLAQAVSEGRRREFAEHGWSSEVPDPQEPGTSAASTLRWEELDQPEHARMLAWYRTLLRLRQDVDDLGSTQLDSSELESGDPLLVIRRGQHRVVVNLTDDEQQLERHDDEQVLASWPELDLGAGTVPAVSALVLGPRDGDV